MAAPNRSADASRLTVGQPGLLARLRGQSRPRVRPKAVRNAGRSFAMTFVAVVALAAFLSPLLRSATMSLKSPEQIADVNSPLYPASAATLTYEGRDYDVYQVPIAGTTRDLALIKKGRTSSQFADPSDVAAPLITWEGAWRTLQPAYKFDPHPENFSNVWDQIDYPTLLRNTILIALIGTIGTVLSAVSRHHAVGLAGRDPSRDLPPRVLVERLLPAADLPLVDARPSDGGGRPRTLQRRAGSFRSGPHPGGNPHDTSDPRPAVPCLPALPRARPRHHGRREVDGL